jgi:hypothetical protein
MKFLHALFGLVILLQAAVFALGLVLIGWAGDDGWFEIYSLAGCVSQLAIGCAGAALLICIGLWLLTGMSRRRCGIVTYEMEGGTVSLRLDAIRDFLARVGQDIPQVASVRPVVRQTDGVVSVLMEIRIRAGSSVPEITRALQERTRHSLAGDLGLTRTDPVKVVITGISGDPTPPPMAKPPAFDRPVYPEDDARGGLRL